MHTLIPIKMLNDVNGNRVATIYKNQANVFFVIKNCLNGELKMWTFNAVETAEKCLRNINRGLM
mgnify:CR=1 FL=1